MKCPVCNTELQMTTRAGIEIDYCPTCRGVWLDRGELDKIIERHVQETQSLCGARRLPTRLNRLRRRRLRARRRVPSHTTTTMTTITIMTRTTSASDAKSATGSKTCSTSSIEQDDWGERTL
jgi:Zn-finger nucleic acid-binding protein